MNKYCYHCKCRIQEWDKYKTTDEGYIHDNDDKDCYAMEQSFVDDFGDILIDEE